MRGLRQRAVPSGEMSDTDWWVIGLIAAAAAFGTYPRASVFERYVSWLSLLGLTAYIYICKAL